MISKVSTASIGGHKSIGVADLSVDQRDAYDRVLGWIKSPHKRQSILTLGGLAGTGKSTVTSVLALHSGIEPIAFMAFTGRASSILRRKLEIAGVDLERHFCGTIHSFMYAPKTKKNRVVVEGDDIRPADDNEYEDVIYQEAELTGWVRKKFKEDAERPRLIVVDEASQVTDDILEDLRDFNIPILAVGDHGQLPPVNGMGALMQDPDIRLEKIHRQAEGNPIIRLAMAVRNTGCFESKYADGIHVKFDRISNLQRHLEERYRTATTEQLLQMAVGCYTNRRRVAINIAVRNIRGTKGPPNIGEQVICLRNNKKRGIYNGMRGFVTRAVERNPERLYQLCTDVRFPEEDVTRYVRMLSHQFNREKTFSTAQELNEKKIIVEKLNEAGELFDFGTTLTVHKMQASSFDDLLLIVERPGGGFVTNDDWKRWAYTATSRASKRITILL
jgi:exodeoxyribonuclease V